MFEDMPQSSIASFELASPNATAAFAAGLGAALGAGDVICLVGDVGAGKTHFARSLIQSRLAEFGIAEDVPSPTFTLVQTYLAGPIEIWHADLYRLTSPHEVDELGLIDAFETALCLVEWPDRITGDFPDSTLWVSLTVDPFDPEKRHAQLASVRPGLWRNRLRGLAT